MTDLSKLLPYANLETIWLRCPFAIALINVNGDVGAVNPAFEGLTGHSETKLLGLSEASFAALFENHPHLTKQRVKVNKDQIRALYYFSEFASSPHNTLSLPHAAELLREHLASIYGFAELLLSQNYDEETRRMLTSTLLEEVEALSNLINEKFDNRKQN